MKREIFNFPKFLRIFEILSSHEFTVRGRNSRHHGTRQLLRMCALNNCKRLIYHHCLTGS